MRRTKTRRPRGRRAARPAPGFRLRAVVGYGVPWQKPHLFVYGIGCTSLPVMVPSTLPLITALRGTLNRCELMSPDQYCCPPRTAWRRPAPDLAVLGMWQDEHWMPFFGMFAPMPSPTQWFVIRSPTVPPAA